jgi:hypothetical protein
VIRRSISPRVAAADRKIPFPKFFAPTRKKLPECAGRSSPNIFLFGFTWRSFNVSHTPPQSKRSPNAAVQKPANSLK